LESLLHVYFNSFTTVKFKIENPSVLPGEGEKITFEWKEFIQNENVVKKIEAYEETDAFICEIMFRKYFKGCVETHIYLHERKDYVRLKKK
jgi:hypothetical protein